MQVRGLLAEGTCPMGVAMSEMMSNEELRREMERLQRENAELKQQTARELTFKISDKGVISVYGMGRFPVSLYRGQWEKLLAAVPRLRAYIEANKTLLDEFEDARPQRGKD